MAKNTTDHAKLAFWQLLEDDDVQQQLRTSATRLREAGQRFSRLPGSRVVEDKTLYDKVRESATALAQAIKLLGAEPEPPKKHRGLQLLVIAVTVGAVAAIVRQSERERA
jgi:hypothetical protein